MFKGAYTALVTPFRDGAIDEKALRDIVEFQISEGIDGLVPCGTTGESATLTHDEHKKVIEITIDAAAGRVAEGLNYTGEGLGGLVQGLFRGGAHRGPGLLGGAVGRASGPQLFE